MFNGYRIISMHIELGKFVPISGKSQDFLYEKSAFKAWSLKVCAGQNC